MTKDNDKDRWDEKIDQNLRKVFQSKLDEDVPDKFMELLAQLREQDDQDRRRAFIDLSEEGAAAMARYFTALDGEGSQLS